MCKFATFTRFSSLIITASAAGRLLSIDLVADLTGSYARVYVLLALLAVSGVAVFFSLRHPATTWLKRDLLHLPSQGGLRVNEPTDDLLFLPIIDLHRLFMARRVSPVEVVRSLLERLDAFEPQLRTHITICIDDALEAARVAERELIAGRALGPLHGIPVSHKDNLWTAGVRTTAHSRTFIDHVPTEDATAVRRLTEAGMILLGKTNTTEFACGDMHIFGHTPNPWDLSRYSGASSAGSASAVAAGLTTAATGSDTGGSIRAPASLCGMIGVKPTYGRVSRFGLVPLSWSMDNVGPMTRTVADAALMLHAMGGWDRQDPTSDRRLVPIFIEVLTPRLEGITIGVPVDHFYDGLTSDVNGAVQEALRTLESLGANLVPIRLPSAGNLAEVGNLLVKWEAFALHATLLRAQAPRYGPKARRNIAAGAFFSSGDVALAQQLRTQWAYELELAFEEVDAIVTPTLPFTAFPWETWVSAPPDTSWGTRHFNLTGHPALSQPCGFDRDGLPIGLQVVAKRFDEAAMFRVAHAYEQATEWHRRRPPLTGPVA